MFNALTTRFLTALLLGLLIHCGGGRTDVPLTPLEPLVTSQPQDQAVKAPAAATFTVAAAGAGGLTYKWSRDGSALDDATAATYTTSAATREMTDAKYTVEVTSPSGSVTSSPGVLTVAYGPTIKVQPATENVLSPAPATFRVEAEGNPLAYQWNRNGAPIAGATSASWNIPASTIAMNGDLFTVTVSCAGTSVTSAPAALNVTSVPVITTQPLGRSLPAGAALTLSVKAVGLPDLLAYQWNKNGEALPGATAASYTVDRATAEDSGSYTVTVTNGAGSTESQKAIVQVAAGYTVSGTATGRAWMTRIQAPASPQAFAVSGVPASTPGAFELMAFLDQDLNGLLSLGDPARTLPAVVASDLRDQALILPSASCTAAVTTRHARYGDAETCTLVFTVRDGANHVASAQLASGPNLPMPASLGAGNGGSVLTFEATPTARPTAGDAYSIVVNFYDGTTETLTVQVTGVLDAFPELQAPDLQGAGSPGDLEPAFAWAAPLAPPPSYHYDFTLKGSGVSWTVTGLPSTTTTLDWSVDPADPANTVTGGLTARVPFTWTLAVVDGSGNSAQVARTYTP